MKRIMEESPVQGYQLFRYEKRKSDGTATILPNFYIRYDGRETCTGTDRLGDAKAAIKKQAGLDVRDRHRRTQRINDVTVGELLDLVIEDYRVNKHKTIKNAQGQIENSLRPYFGEMLADRLDSEQIEKWIASRKSNRLRKSIRGGHVKLQSSSINRELSLLRRAYQLGYERKPAMVEKIPVFKKLAENNIRKGFVSVEQYHALIQELPAHLRPITCIAFHVANRKGELLNMEWPDVDLNGNPPVFTLWPGETKNKEGRTLPILNGEMMDTLRSVKEEHQRKWPKKTHVFLNADGNALQYHMMRRDWDAACTRAGVPGLLFHDLRRSAVRNLRRAGVTQKVAREFSGHKTDSVFDRYNISDFEDLKDAAAKLGRFLRPSNDETK